MRTVRGLRLVPMILLILILMACETVLFRPGQIMDVRFVGVPTEIHHTHGEIAAHSVQIVNVFFNAGAVYQSFCDIYAIEADVHIADAIIAVRVPIQVIREEAWKPGN